MPNVADLTLEEFRELVRQTVRETMLEFSDPDAGLVLRPEIEALLSESVRGDERVSVETLVGQHGLKW
jgi:hypothetical protein